MQRCVGTHIIPLSPDPSGLWRSSGNLWKLLSSGESGAVGIPGDGGSCLVHGQEVLDLGQAWACGVLWLRHDGVVQEIRNRNTVDRRMVMQAVLRCAALCCTVLYCASLVASDFGNDGVCPVPRLYANQRPLS